MKKESLGFALLETLLALVIITIASLGIFALFQSASQQNKVNVTKNIIEQVSGIASELMHSNLSVTTDNVINSGLVAQSYLKTSGSSTKLVGPYGEINISTRNIPGSYVVSIGPLSSSAAVALCNVMQSSAGVATWEHTGMVPTQGTCSGSYSGTVAPQYGMEFYFPKASWA